MPWKSLGKVPPQVKKHKGAKLTLSQANYVARIADGSGSWAIAWSQFEKKYKREGDKWVLRKKKKK